MHGSPYSPLKIIHHPEKLEQLRSGQQITSLQVQLIISDLCNQDCGFCAYRMTGYASNQLFMGDSEPAAFGHSNPKRMIPYEKIVEILDDCVEMGVKAIQLTGGGEPTVHPKHTDVFQDVLDRGLDLSLVTNGLNLTHDDITLLARAAWVRFSLDAGCAKTYASVRNVNPDHWARVWEHVGQLVEGKQSQDLIIGIGFVITKDNWREVVQCTEKARAVGVDNIRISAVFQSEDEKYFEGFYEEVADLCRVAALHATDTFHVFNMFGDRVEDLALHHPDYTFCGYQEFNTYIGGDLNVYRCCNLAYNERGKIGSLKEQRFRDLWASQQKREAFSSFDATGCPRCMFNNKNRTINYAIAPDPMHVNYI